MFSYEHLPNSRPNPRSLKNNFVPLATALTSLQLDAEIVILLDRATKVPTPMLKRMFNDLPKKAIVVKCNSFMHDAVFPILAAKDVINIDEEIVVVNNVEIFTKPAVDIRQAVVSLQQYDAGVVTNSSLYSLNKFARLTSEGNVSEIINSAEDNLRLLGMYYWKKGTDLILSAEDMLAHTPDKSSISDTLNILINKQRRVGSFSS